jgi:hypothetical protein
MRSCDFPFYPRKNPLVISHGEDGQFEDVNHHAYHPEMGHVPVRKLLNKRIGNQRVENNIFAA